MTETEKKELAHEIAEYVKQDLCNEKSTCPLGLKPAEVIKWQGMLKIAGIVGVAAAWAVVVAIAGGFVAALWAGIRHFVNVGFIRL